jgi:hypothetical protein
MVMVMVVKQLANPCPLRWITAKGLLSLQLGPPRSVVWPHPLPSTSLILAKTVGTTSRDDGPALGSLLSLLSFNTNHMMDSGDLPALPYAHRHYLLPFMRLPSKPLYVQWRQQRVIPTFSPLLLLFWPASLFKSLPSHLAIPSWCCLVTSLSSIYTFPLAAGVEPLCKTLGPCCAVFILHCSKGLFCQPWLGTSTGTF